MDEVDTDKGVGALVHMCDVSAEMNDDVELCVPIIEAALRNVPWGCEIITLLAETLSGLDREAVPRMVAAGCIDLILRSVVAFNDGGSVKLACKALAGLVSATSTDGDSDDDTDSDDDDCDIPARIHREVCGFIEEWSDNAHLVAVGRRILRELHMDSAPVQGATWLQTSRCDWLTACFATIAPGEGHKRCRKD